MSRPSKIQCSQVKSRRDLLFLGFCFYREHKSKYSGTNVVHDCSTLNCQSPIIMMLPPPPRLSLLLQKRILASWKLAEGPEPIMVDPNLHLLQVVLSGFTVICCCCCQVASVVSDSVQPHRWQPTRLLRLWDFPGKNTGVGCHCLLLSPYNRSEILVYALLIDLCLCCFHKLRN